MGNSCLKCGKSIPDWRTYCRECENIIKAIGDIEDNEENTFPEGIDGDLAFDM